MLHLGLGLGSAMLLIMPVRLFPESFSGYRETVSSVPRVPLPLLHVGPGASPAGLLAFQALQLAKRQGTVVSRMAMPLKGLFTCLQQWLVHWEGRCMALTGFQNAGELQRFCLQPVNHVPVQITALCS